MVFEEEPTSVSPADTEGFTLQNKSPLSCPPCPPVPLSPSRVATPAGSPLAPLTQAQAFSLNKNSTLCLPVFSADNKLVWVRSESIAQEVAHAADALHGAFGVFPYPKREEVAKLARRCSLHVDHVRVWFMFQRLHYGISWDHADIHEVRRRLLAPGRRSPARAARAARGGVLEEAGGRGGSGGSGSWVKMGARGVATEEGEEGRGGGSGETGAGLEVGGEEEEEGGEEEQGQEGRVEAPGRPRKRKLGEEKEKGETAKKRTRAGKVDKRSARDKGDRARVRRGAPSTEEERPPKRKDGEPGRVEGGTALLANRGPVPESAASPTPPPGSSVRGRPYRRPRTDDLPPNVKVSEGPPASKGHTGPSPGAGENRAGREADSAATASGDDDGVDGVAPGDGPAHGNTSALGDLGRSKAKARPPAAKPQTEDQRQQLQQLRGAFLACQYPNPSDYERLSEWTGRQRSQLTQWFADRRYDVKNSKPRWITPQEQQQVLARMRQRQRMKHLSGTEAGAGREAASDPGARTWRLKLEERSAIPIPTAPTAPTSPRSLRPRRSTGPPWGDLPEVGSGRSW